ncbi:hypothetical protein Nepgr_001823 [Nepenthes gracilis]|uniref:Uncharacterized protein n=1 Tax=Nepenthes gracilis TaxID=150966 RepID=A0AAD3P551_NEPGR|nr:hypothetical protein Nepgr_001823 [Nepenthes gracilis]
MSAGHFRLAQFGVFAEDSDARILCLDLTVFSSMESPVGMQETSTVDEKYHSYELVPWLNCDELDSISVWRSRGCSTVVIEVTASIIKLKAG